MVPSQINILNWLACNLSQKKKIKRYETQGNKQNPKGSDCSWKCIFSKPTLAEQSTFLLWVIDANSAQSAVVTSKALGWSVWKLWHHPCSSWEAPRMALCLGNPSYAGSGWAAGSIRTRKMKAACLIGKSLTNTEPQNKSCLVTACTARWESHLQRPPALLFIINIIPSLIFRALTMHKTLQTKQR